MPLSAFPRPAADNGIGIHFGFDYASASLAAFTQKMVELRFKWCLVPHRDELQLQHAAQMISSAGIQPISRWTCLVDENILDFVQFIRVFDALQIPAYIQVFNEPSNPAEWRDNLPKPKAFIARWCDHAARVADAGGYPGLQVLHPDELRVVLTELKTRGAANVLERMWFCPHPYGSNHPPDYPFDIRNQHDHPGATLSDDPAAVLQFLEFAPVFAEQLGFIPPFIAGEGGWQFGSAEDTRYPKVDDATHARYHAALFDWFRSGKLSNGAPLPDYLFAFCPWILFGREADAWYSSTTGVRQETLDALRAIPAYLRGGLAASTFQTITTPPPNHKVLHHYVLLGATAHAQWFRLVLIRQYIAHFNVTLGFGIDEAFRAERVTILGDYSFVSAADEFKLKANGCRVERLLGDLQSIEIILSDRLARNVEYG